MIREFSLRLLALACIVTTWGCSSGGGPQGQLVGSTIRVNNTSNTPIGMTWVPSGVMHMGASDQDIKGGYDVKNRTVQMIGFYMDATEITNAEYRQFTNYVRDSTAHSILQHYKEVGDNGDQIIDWKQRIKWNTQDVKDELSAYYVPAAESIWGKEEFDNTKLVYHYEAFDYDQMARDAKYADPNQANAQVRASYKKAYDIKVYPDTTVWMKMFTYSYNEPIAHQYNWYAAFDRYPVVGVSWTQALAFCDWRTHFWRRYRDQRRMYLEGNFKLPTEEQWEWAARGGRTQSPYPWGGPYLVNKKGCYLANFKPNRGNYSADGGLYTVRADAYHPNDYGLYNMSGNVAEWTMSPYVTNTYGIVDEMSPSVRSKAQSSTDPEWWKRKVIRGGSWKDVASFLQVGSRDYEFADTAKAYIGFRCILEYIAPALSNRGPRR